MRNVILFFSLLFLSVSAFSQFSFDLGLKGGATFSKVSLDIDDYNAEAVTKTHFGAFTQLGFGRFFIQPEFLYSNKGGEVSSGGSMVSFDYSTFDVPVLFGFKAIKQDKFNLHFVAGPVFSNVTSENISGDELLNKSFYEDKYYGIQYGLGFDVLFLTFDARMENGLSNFYSHGASNAKNNSIILSVGFKIL